MLGQVVIGTVCDSPQLAPSEREQELDIGCSLAAVSYTHLDVYKRQVQKQYNLFLFFKPFFDLFPQFSGQNRTVSHL